MRYLFVTTLVLSFLTAKLPAELSTVDNNVESTKGVILITDRHRDERIARMGQRADSEITFGGTGPAFTVDIAAQMTSQTTKPIEFFSSVSNPNNFIPLKSGTYLLTYTLSIFSNTGDFTSLITVELGGINDGLGGTSFTNSFQTFDSNNATLSVVTDLTAFTPVTLTAFITSSDTTDTSILSGATFSATLLSDE